MVRKMGMRYRRRMVIWKRSRCFCGALKSNAGRRNKTWDLKKYGMNIHPLRRTCFRKSVRRLLKQTFIVRDRDEDSKKAYYFVSKRSEPFSAYLGYIGYDIVIDRENGVIMLQNCRDLGENGKLQINHVTLKKMESVVLCCLWTLYADRVRSGNLSKNIEISVTDLRYEMEKIRHSGSD